ncbi:ParB/RepB/Spo0J family partition protein [Corynebacterium mendelii]|uniref:ParB/RepB/Spo0J family partition protein n=1 Tax=Corynebacterium mendelii TaxID=2765362 RepID=A0A939IVJ8_9CORY|nr:ParB/RepB/Spo0J family partition protein [Corynebacterium mendelii]MBN9644301.1 ParB/RepB/Spo0J family partition protein [Corynebacterium mendelii]
MAGEKHTGGLGRGLASLIPTEGRKPRIGDGAADIVFGSSKGKGTAAAADAPTAAAGGGTDPAAQAAARKAAARKAAATGARSSGRRRSSTPATGQRKPAATNDFGAVYREIPVAAIEPNPKQPRHVFDEDALNELVHSISEFGLMQPIVVRPAGDGNGPEQRFELIMGERRWRAAEKAGLAAIPAIVRHTDDGDMLRDALLENIHRVQLNPLEEAAAYAQLLEEFGVTQAQLAERLGRSRPVISNMIRLLDLPMPVQRKVAAGVLSAGHARALLGVKAGAEAQSKLALRVVAEGLSVRATEEAVTLLNNHGDGEETKPAPRPKKTPPEFATRAADQLADGLDTKVTVAVGRKNRGRIIVEFADKDDLERIMALLSRR